MKKKPIGAGKDSIELIDGKRLFQALELKRDTVMLDMACGMGSYSIEAAKFIDNRGIIYAADLWEDGIASLREHALKNGLAQIRPILADVSRELPIDTGSVDLCLMAVVIHDLVRADTLDGALREVSRLLGPDGRLAAVEFKRIKGPPGPPMDVRLSPEELDDLIGGYGFNRKLFVEIGPYNYLSTFEKQTSIFGKGNGERETA